MRANLKDRIRKYNFVGVDMDKLNLLLNTIRRDATEYFEAKIQSW